MQLAVARVLIPTMGAAEARATAVDDWETDRAVSDRLDYSRLFSAVFEMADLWCPGLAVEEYVSFLDAPAEEATFDVADIDLDSILAKHGDAMRAALAAPDASAEDRDAPAALRLSLLHI